MSTHRDIVKKTLDSKAIDFSAIGKLVSDLGPGIALDDDPWESFCWTMRLFVHFYRRPPFGGPGDILTDLEKQAMH